MTANQPRTPGNRGSVRALYPDRTECTVAAQAVCRGELDYRVLAVSARVAGAGQEHIALRFGRVLLYLEDRAALQALQRAVAHATELADTVFEPISDAFAAARRADLRAFERSR